MTKWLVYRQISNDFSITPVSVENRLSTLEISVCDLIESTDSFFLELSHWTEKESIEILQFHFINWNE